MSPVADVLVILIVTLLGIAYRQRENKSELAAAGICTALLAMDLLRWPAVRLGVGPAETALGIVAVVAWFNVVGFPRPFVRVFLAGYRSPEWDFDVRFHNRKARLDRLLLAYRTSEDWDVYRRWQKSTLERGRRIVRDWGRAKAPTAEWAALRDGYVRLYSDILGRIERDELPDDEDTLRRGSALKEGADLLRIAYRMAARQWMQGSAKL